jgi:ribosome-associated toxin RatA of RatAB toxin-antitoxin module
MRSTVSIEVAAPPDLLFRLARDIERWPQVLPHYRGVRAIERRADGSLLLQMLAIRAIVPVIGLGVPIVWRARTWNEPDTLRLRFVHQGGATAGMNVTWRIESTGDGCRVSIDHEFRPSLPPLFGRAWATFIDRLFVGPIATRTLRTFKAIAEVVGAVAPSGDQSNPAAAANPPA